MLLKSVCEPSPHPPPPHLRSLEGSPGIRLSPYGESLRNRCDCSVAPFLVLFADLCETTRTGLAAAKRWIQVKVQYSYIFIYAVNSRTILLLYYVCIYIYKYNYALYISKLFIRISIHIYIYIMYVYIYNIITQI